MFSCLLLAGCATTAPILSASTDSHTDPSIKRIPLPGDGRGDYIFADAVNRRLYVTHTSRVHILDLDSLLEVAEVTGLTKAQGVAPVPELNRGFVTDGKANQVVMFALDSGKTLRVIPAARKPDSIVYDTASKLVFVFGGQSADCTVINPRTGEIVKTIPLGDKPEFSRSDGKGLVWVNLAETATVAAIDTRSLEVVARHFIDGCEDPSALALDTTGGTLITTCGNKVLKVLNSATGKTVASAPIGDDADGAVFDSAKETIYVTNRDGTMNIITRDRAGRYDSKAVITELYAKTLAFDPVRGRLFSSTADLIWPDGKPDTTGAVLPDARPGSFHLLVLG